MLDNHSRAQLCFIIQQYGQTIINEPKRCKGLLSDLAPQNRLENNLLISALEQNVAQELLQSSALISTNITIDLLTQRLHDAVGTREDYAYWAVESWALALGVIKQPIPKQTVQSIPNISPPVQIAKPQAIPHPKVVITQPPPIATLKPQTSGKNPSSSNSSAWWIVGFIFIVTLLSIATLERLDSVGTLRAFYQAIASHDCAKAVSLAEGYSQERCLAIANLQLGDNISVVAEQPDKSILKFNVSYQLHQQKIPTNTDATLAIKRVDNQWKVDFSSLKILPQAI